MNKFTPLALAATLATFALVPVAVHAQGTAPASAVAGKTLYGANGQRIAPIYRVTSAGVIQVILDGKLINVPTDSVSETDGKVVTSLSKSDLKKRK